MTAETLSPSPVLTDEELDALEIDCERACYLGYPHMLLTPSLVAKLLRASRSPQAPSWPGREEVEDWRTVGPDSPPTSDMVELLVDYSGEDDDHALEDTTDLAWTIGFWNKADVGEDEAEWRFAGWCWSHDHFVQGRGTPKFWRPVRPVGEHPK